MKPSAAVAATLCPKAEVRRGGLGGLGGLDDDVLAAVAYGPGGVRCADPRVVNIGLRALPREAAVELWRADGPVQQGEFGSIRYACRGDFLFGTIELDERDHGGIRGAGEAAYREISRLTAGRSERHLLRMWNYIASINDGRGDDERYKQFCLGRARGLDWLAGEALPAGTAVGRRDGSPLLQVCWLAGREPGQPLENPRQTQAYRYPRQYGPAPPSFCRAIVAPGGGLLVSGTASIVGSESRHPGDLAQQLEETGRNLRRLLETCYPGRQRLPGPSLVKAYLRDADDAQAVQEALGRELPGAPQVLLLEADICRAELLVEVECLFD